MTHDREGLVANAMAHIERLMSYRRQSLCANGHVRDISLPQFYVLVTLQERGALTVTELAHLLDISAPSASSILDRMEESGYVQRERSTTDRRIVHVLISDHGRKLVENLMGVKRDRLMQLFAVLSEDELHALIRGAEALASGLDRLQGQGSEGLDPAV